MENPPPVPFKSSHPRPWRNWGDHPVVVSVFVIAALAGIATLILMFGHDPAQVAVNPSGSPPGQAEPPKFRNTGEDRPPAQLSSPVTLQELSAYVYEGNHTSAQISEFVNHNLKRSVVWEGWVGNVSSNVDDTFTVIVKPSMGSMAGLGWFNFGAAYKPEMLNLSYGQKIKARGTFTNFDGRLFTLDKCELLQVLPASK